MGLYNTVVVDPPWPVRKTNRRTARPNQGVALDYKTMSLEEIKAFPIDQWTSPSAYLFLWTTNGFLEAAFDVLRSWNFRYFCTLTWCKPTGVCPFAPFQLASEFMLFGYRDGRVFRRFPVGRLKSWFVAPVTGHSRKPADFYEHIRAITPEPRIDLFARKRHLGFDAYGDQVEESSESPLFSL